MSYFSCYNDILQHLDARGLFHMDFGLDRIKAVLNALALTRPPYVTIHTVGTNGKGSTSTFLASLGKAHGFTTGLYTSPHLLTPRERIRVDGHMLDEATWCMLGNRLMEAGGESLTYFEFMTVLAVLAFAHRNVDVAIIEAGLGGTWDATAAIETDFLCITPIGLDHQHILGATLAEIARDKAGAIRHGQTVFIASQENEALQEIIHSATLRDATLIMAHAVEPLPTAERLGLHGEHQTRNAQLALAAWHHIAKHYGWEQSVKAENEGLASAFIVGRYQFVPASQEHGLPFPMILDGAHNPHGLEAFAHALTKDNIIPRAIIFSCLADKDVHTLTQRIRDIAGTAPILVPTIANNPRAAESTAIASTLGEQAIAVPTLQKALEHLATLSSSAAKEKNSRPVILCGSFYLLAEFLQLYPHIRVE